MGMLLLCPATYFSLEATLGGGGRIHIVSLQAPLVLEEESCLGSVQKFPAPLYRSEQISSREGTMHVIKKYLKA